MVWQGGVWVGQRLEAVVGLSRERLLWPLCREQAWRKRGAAGRLVRDCLRAGGGVWTNSRSDKRGTDQDAWGVDLLRLVR